MSGFRLDVHPDELRGETLLVDLHDDECTVTVAFRPKIDETSSPAARKLIASLGDDWAYVQYIVKNFNIVKIMEEVRIAINSLHKFRNYAFQKKGTAFSDDSLAEALRPLASVGYQLYTKLFSFGLNPDSTNIETAIPRGKLKPYGEMLRKWLDRTQALHILCRRCILPWNLMYPAPVHDSSQKVRVESFWGFSKRLQLIDVGITNLALMRSEWRVAAGVETADAELQDGRLIHDDANHPFRAGASGRVSWHNEPRSLFLDLERDIVYHFGHASGTTRGYAYNRVMLNGIGFSSADLETMIANGDLPVSTDSPRLLYLNGCSTAVGSGAAGDSTLVDTLVQGCPDTFCFVTTLGEVPPWAAAEFARRFFDAYLGSANQPPRSLGASLAVARQEMLADYNSPIGLLYEALGKYATKLATPPAVELEPS